MIIGKMETPIENKIEKRKPGRPSTNDSRRKEILEKSTECFIKFGFNKTTLDEIGDAIGFNKAALYYYFKNKEELFIQVVNNQLTLGLNKLQVDLSETPDNESKILKYLWNRTQVYANLVKLTSLSSENILDLNSTFNEIYSPYKKSEIRYLSGILIKSSDNKTIQEVDEFAENLLDLVNSMGLSALLVKNISNQVQHLEAHNAKKEVIVKMLLKAFNCK
jgi:AcrR family transcriptional regulator